MQEKILVTGAGGQLGRELLLTAGPQQDCVGLDREQFDLANPVAMQEVLDELSPRQVINTAAYTAVDAAESDREEAWRVNHEGARQLAQACARRGIRLVHVSTDFVFDGSATSPYLPTDDPAPLGEYGSSKLAGEQAVLESGADAVVVRTGWVYSRFGRNFVKTMLKLMSERDTLAVVGDQIGTPTWARGLAKAIWAFCQRGSARGIYHWSDEGACSWYQFAVAIFEEATDLGLLTNTVHVRSIPGSEYPTPARRPAYSVLDKSSSWAELGINGTPWRRQLRAMMEDLQEHMDD